MRATILLLPALLLLSACRPANHMGPANGSGLLVPGDTPAVHLVEDPGRWPHDPYALGTFSLAGDLLHATIQYGGGCTEHTFALLVVPIFQESYPVQMRGSLAHNAHGDMCRALIRRELTFDLSPLRAAYAAAYGASSATIVLHIAGWPRPVHYEF
jgi:hypothetical protein